MGRSREQRVLRSYISHSLPDFRAKERLHILVATSHGLSYFPLVLSYLLLSFSVLAIPVASPVCFPSPAALPVAFPGHVGSSNILTISYRHFFPFR